MIFYCYCLDPSLAFNGYKAAPISLRLLKLLDCSTEESWIKFDICFEAYWALPVTFLYFKSCCRIAYTFLTLMFVVFLVAEFGVMNSGR